MLADWMAGICKSNVFKNVAGFFACCCCLRLDLIVESLKWKESRSSVSFVPHHQCYLFNVKSCEFVKLIHDIIYSIENAEILLQTDHIQSSGMNV